MTRTSSANWTDIIDAVVPVQVEVLSEVIANLEAEEGRKVPLGIILNEYETAGSYLLMAIDQRIDPQKVQLSTVDMLAEDKSENHESIFITIAPVIIIGTEAVAKVDISFKRDDPPLIKYVFALKKTDGDEWKVKESSQTTIEETVGGAPVGMILS